MPIALPKISKKKNRIGRGIGGRGAKSGRGQKGQKSRAGYSRKLGHEGGQTPLYMRLPKGRGRKQWPNSLHKKPICIEVGQLTQLSKEGIVGPGSLRVAGMLKRRSQRIKLIAGGELKEKLTVRVHAATPNSIKAVESAGGKVELITKQ